MAAFRAALAFLTVVPAGRRGPTEALSASLAYFPWVGLLLGLSLAGLNWILGAVFAPGVVDALLVLALVAITGALHLDGLMDSCDGLFGVRDSERRLEIMKDSRVGGFGVAGAATILILKYAAFGALLGSTKSVALILAPVLSRWAIVYAVVAFPYARPQGLGTAFRPSGRSEFFLASVSALAMALVLGRIWGLWLVLAAWLATWLVARMVLTRIPGLTGDVYGAINEVVEVVVLLLAAPLSGLYAGVLSW